MCISNLADAISLEAIFQVTRSAWLAEFAVLPKSLRPRQRDERIIWLHVFADEVLSSARTPSG
jgi:hypothetical protein